jgi:hypothetical protein
VLKGVNVDAWPQSAVNSLTFGTRDDLTRREIRSLRLLSVKERRSHPDFIGNRDTVRICSDLSRFAHLVVTLLPSVSRHTKLISIRG